MPAAFVKLQTKICANMTLCHTACNKIQNRPYHMSVSQDLSNRGRHQHVAIPACFQFLFLTPGIFTTGGKKTEKIMTIKIIIISFIKSQCVDGHQWHWWTVAIILTNSEQMFGGIRKCVICNMTYPLSTNMQTCRQGSLNEANIYTCNL